MNNDITDNYEKIGYLHQHYKFFHIKDKEDRDFSYHYHDFDKIVYFLDGKADYMIEGKQYTLQPYDFVLVNRNEIHKPIVDFSLPYERIILYIEHEFLEKYKGTDYDLTGCFVKSLEAGVHVVRFPAPANNQLYEILVRMEENDKKKVYARELYGELLFLEFMILLNSACCEYEMAYNSNVKYNKKVIDMIWFINRNLAEDLSIEVLSERFYISKYHMMRQFKEETGYSLHQYITEKRILAAKAMLLDGVPAATAAMECGFNDYSTFARAFKKTLGVIPTSFLK